MFNFTHQLRLKIYIVFIIFLTSNQTFGSLREPTAPSLLLLNSFKEFNWAAMKKNVIYTV